MTSPSTPGPAGFGAGAEPPPVTAFAFRNGLVRPAQGRILAGVCAALGRATNTDPVLWRVVLAVLSLFGGIGVLAYLLGWLLMPAEGDTATPVEALVGRGHSGTSSVITVLVAIIVVLALAVAVSEPFRPGLLGAVLLGGAVLLLLRDQRTKSRVGPAAASGPAPGVADPATAAPADPGTGEPAGAQGWPGGVAATAVPTRGAETGPGGAAPPPPFAPHGPFQPAHGQRPYGPPAPPGPYGPPGQYGPPGGPPPYGYGRPPGPPPPPPRPPKPPKPTFRLGLLTMSMILIGIGLLAAFDVAYGVPGTAYIALTLAVIGVGLVIGAWLGRSRGLIPLGILVTLALAAGVGARDVHHDWSSVTWTPTNVTELTESSFEHQLGRATLDLTNVDFASMASLTDTMILSAKVDVGELIVILPPDVDVVVEASVDVGEANVFNETWGGLGQTRRVITDNGADGPGGGTLRLDARVDVGSLEVTR
jgi:phage shock protein PspC (stress-responsive transcriptional regulator)/predicted membrane protein